MHALLFISVVPRSHHEKNQVQYFQYHKVILGPPVQALVQKYRASQVWHKGKIRSPTGITITLGPIRALRHLAANLLCKSQDQNSQNLCGRSFNTFRQSLILQPPEELAEEENTETCQSQSCTTCPFVCFPKFAVPVRQALERTTAFWCKRGSPCPWKCHIELTSKAPRKW